MFGERLALLRTKLNLTQADFSKKLGIPRSTYSNYESGKRQPDFDTLQKIADFFEVSTDFLLGRDNLKQHHPDESLFFFDEDNITEEEKEALKEHLKFLRWKAAQENNKKN